MTDHLSHLPHVEKFFGSEGLLPEYAELRDYILQKLLAEHPGIDTLDTVLMERVSYIYARIRQKEAAGAFGNENNYRRAATILSSYMGEVRKSDDRQKLLELIKADAVALSVQALKQAVAELPPPQQKQVMAKVIKLVHSSDESDQSKVV